jgi:hypothetical protein
MEYWDDLQGLGWLMEGFMLMDDGVPIVILIRTADQPFPLGRLLFPKEMRREADKQLQIFQSYKSDDDRLK